MQIGIGEWKMHNGQKAIVAAHRPGTMYPWIGWFDGDGVWPRSWSDDGICSADSLSYNIASTWTSPIAAGHNPDKLTEEQVGVADGWRLPEWDEIDGLNGEKKVSALEYFNLKLTEWHNADVCCAYRKFTYRTKLSREELAALRKTKMRIIRVEELPPVCWVKTGSLVCLVVEMDSATQTVKAGGEKPVEIKMLRRLNAGWSSDLRNWNLFEVEDKQ